MKIGLLMCGIWRGLLINLSAAEGFSSAAYLMAGTACSPYAIIYYNTVSRK